ncbi:MAG: hypothetical protein SH809_04015 [Rhodothermales bacterium]|nr:hypothetical protein [Rhodothermales bacterium]
MSHSYDLTAAVRALSESDVALAAVIRRLGACTLVIEPIDDPFHALLKTIVYQQLSGRAAGTIHRRVLGLAPEGVLTADSVLALPEEALRGAGLSRNKLAAIQDLARKTLDGTVPRMAALHNLPDDEIVARLSAVRGVGRWTVEMLLIFNLGRRDVLPSTDLGVRKGFQRLGGYEELPPPRALEAYAERWRPHRSVASWYMWRLVDGDTTDWG